MNNDLFQPCECQGIPLRNRIVMAPLTRCRAGDDGVPGVLQATYYAQRATAGLIISEAIAIAPEARGGIGVPGLWDNAQVAGWRLSTDAVHQAGGVIFAQLWHAGRAGHSSLSADGKQPVAPVAKAAIGTVHTKAGILPLEVPHALTTAEMEHVLDQFAQAGANAVAAGFDGVEIHAGHGFLIDSFLRDAINDRSDIYGGAIENRARLAVDVIKSLTRVMDPSRIGVRLSPDAAHTGMTDSDPEATFGYLIERLDELRIGWLHIIEGDTMVSRNPPGAVSVPQLTRRFSGCVILNNGYDLELAVAARLSKTADLISFGRPFLANPDLVERMRDGHPLAATPPHDTWYSSGPAGLSDYPTWRGTAA